MQDKTMKVTLSLVEVDNIYRHQVDADIDGANEIIWLTTTHVNKKNNIDERRSLAVNYKELKQLMHVINDNMLK